MEDIREKMQQDNEIEELIFLGKETVENQQDSEEPNV
jgi:hypothetical protein